MNKYLLELVVFVCGAVVMIYEIVGSRVVGPFLGNSVFIWTSLIGIILGSLSLGYYLGGRLADRKPSLKILGLIILAAALLILLNNWGKDYFLARLPRVVPGLKMQSVVSAVILFGPASVFLGMVSPYAVRLKIKSLVTSGATVGNMYAISTIGSITGTFAAGFLLIPLMGTNQVLYLLVVILVLMAGLAFIGSGRFPMLAALLVVAVPGVYGWVTDERPTNLLADTDTKYSRVLVYDEPDYYTGKPARYMQINKNRSSGMILGNEEPAFKYAFFYLAAEYFNPGFRNSLMLGGAAYTFPMFYLKLFPDATIDVVEIDEGLTEIAREHFNLRDDPRLRIFHEDGRIYLNRTSEKYDIFYGDAYNSLYTIPWHLTTVEAVRHIHDVLTEDGVAFVNVISSIKGRASEFLGAEMRTFMEVFPEVRAYALHNPEDEDLLQSIVILAFKNSPEPGPGPNIEYYKEFITGHEVTGKISLDKPVLTDQYAPVSFYTNKAVK